MAHADGNAHPSKWKAHEKSFSITILLHSQNRFTEVLGPACVTQMGSVGARVVESQAPECPAGTLCFAHLEGYLDDLPLTPPIPGFHKDQKETTVSVASGSQVCSCFFWYIEGPGFPSPPFLQ